MKLPAVIPAKNMIIPTILVVAAVLYAYNKVPRFAALLGNPNKAA